MSVKVVTSLPVSSSLDWLASGSMGAFHAWDCECDACASATLRRAVEQARRGEVPDGDPPHVAGLKALGTIRIEGRWDP